MLAQKVNALASLSENFRQHLNPTPVSFLPSYQGPLDDFLEGGLRLGQVSEWGLPLGRGAREVMIRFLCQRRRPPSEEKFWGLWIYAQKEDLRIYPPAWSARGVDLKHLCFSYSEKPLHDLKEVFLDPFFRLIVIDTDHRLKNEDCAFLAQRARINHQAIMILRSYFLSPKRGNVWARARFNCWQDGDASQFHLQTIRGPASKHLTFCNS